MIVGGVSTGSPGRKPIWRWRISGHARALSLSIGEYIIYIGRPLRVSYLFYCAYIQHFCWYTYIRNSWPGTALYSAFRFLSLAPAQFLFGKKKNLSAVIEKILWLVEKLLANKKLFVIIFLLRWKNLSVGFELRRWGGKLNFFFFSLRRTP